MFQGKGIIVRRNQIVDTGGATSSTLAYGILSYGPGGRVLNNDIISTAGTSSGLAYGLRFDSAAGAVIESNRIDDVSSGDGNRLRDRR